MTTSPPATIGRRLASMLYEGLVVFSILLIGFWIPQALLSGIGIVFNARGLWLHVFVLLMLYFLWFWLNGGQTLPMKTWKLRIVNSDGSPPRPAQALLRYLAAWPSIVLFGLGIAWALIDRDKQFFHDRIAGTRIVSTAN
ncbi:MAG: RDD family protein [Azonexus sp.]|nr:RDD family protein [Azonexus sp.]